MKHVAILWLSTVALVCGCGGNGAGRSGGGDRPPQGLEITGNWEFSVTSTVVPGSEPATIASSITQSGSSVNGVGHVQGSDCFDRLITIPLTGTLTDSNLSLTSTPIAGQVIAVTGSIANSALTGTYTVSGGCANGDRGTVAGLNILPMSGKWRSLFSINEQHYPGITNMFQDSPSSEGSFGVTGTVDDSSNLSCLTGTITPGTFPLPSYIIGSSVALEINGNDGTILFQGKLNQAGEIHGEFTISGGTCDSTFGFACFVRGLHSICKVPF